MANEGRVANMGARNPQYWRQRAGDCRIELRRTDDPEAQRILGMLASACEEVAEMLERGGRIIVLPPPPSAPP